MDKACSVNGVRPTDYHTPIMKYQPCGEWNQGRHL